MSKVKVFICILLVVIIAVLYGARSFPPAPITYGITFSDIFAEELTGDWRAVYTAILDDLRVRELRLVAYWDEVEPFRDAYDFSRFDWQVSEAEKRGARIILAVGLKLPRWPECHRPAWVLALSPEERERELLEYIEAVVLRYKGSFAVRHWQVENEPFLSFGDACPKTEAAVLDREIALVHALDPRPVLVTDSGELGRWIPAARRGDVFGTTMYFQIQNDSIGQFVYPLHPAFFRLKRRVTDLFSQSHPKIVIEFQMEPWNKKQIYETDTELQLRTFAAVPFDERIAFVERTGFDTVYLWGGEWWYWLKQEKGNTEFWEKAKKLFMR